MTDEAPERIWLQLGAGEYGSHTWCDQLQDWADENGEGEPEYLRADLTPALVAEAYEVARNVAITTPSDYAAPTARIEIANAIDRRTPADAIAARDADRKQVREQALKEAAAVAEKYDKAATCMGCADTVHIFCEIRALIEKDKPNDG